jgi:hypothetical protein
VTEKIILIGGGGHCKSCIDVIQAEGRFEIAGIVENKGYQVSGVGYQVMGYPVIGTDDDLPELIKEYKNVLITVGQIQHPDIRIKLYNLIKGIGGKFPVIVSPNAYVSRSALIGEGGGGRSLGSQTDEASGAGEKERKGLHGRVVKVAFR